jgi:hypothetical protein
MQNWVLAISVLVGCGGEKVGLVDTSLQGSGYTTSTGTTDGTTSSDVPDVSYAFVSVEWAMAEPAPPGIVHAIMFAEPFDDPLTITAEPVERASTMLDGGFVSGDNMATYIFENLDTSVTYSLLAFLDEDNTGGVDEPRPDSGDFLAMVADGYPTLVFTQREGNVVAEVNTAVP